MIAIETIGKDQDKILKAISKGHEIWCCENSLAKILPIIFPNQTIIHNKNLTVADRTFRPDFLLPDKKIIIEFQGYRHFTDPKVIFTDLIKRDLFLKNDYSFIEIPYFVQLTPALTHFFFKAQQDFSNGFPHGFIHPSAMLPGSFSTLGLIRYHKFLDYLPEEVALMCIESLKQRAKIDKMPIIYYNPKSMEE